MSENSLLNAKWADAVVAQGYAEIEARVHAYMDAHPEVDISDLVLQYTWNKDYDVRVITAEERWLNWFSENDG